MSASDKAGGQTSGPKGPRKGTMQDEAIHWLLKQREGDMDAQSWEAFTLWLEASPDHARAYDEVVAADDLFDLPIEQAPAAQTPDNPANDDLPEPANDNALARLLPFAMASAAAILLAIFVWPQGGGSTVQVATMPGETQTLALTDQVTMTVNGGTTVSYLEGQADVTVERGEVFFAVNSPTAKALRVNVADLVLTDYGTQFSVTLDSDEVRVAVSEGIVAVNPDAEAIEINAGEAVEKALDAPAFTKREVDPAIVGSWRTGRLEFDDTPLSDAIAQIGRSTGMAIATADRFEGARLTGSIVLADDKAQIAQGLAAILGGTARQTNARSKPPSDRNWIIE